MSFGLGFSLVKEYNRKRKHFGRPCQFSSVFHTTHNIPPNPEEYRLWHTPPTSDVAISCIPSMSEHEVNTHRYETTSTGVLHTEGGWPRNIDPTQAEHTTGFRKKVEKDEKYVSAVIRMTETIIATLDQNSAMDIYELYFDTSSSAVTSTFSSEADSDESSTHTISLFHDKSGSTDRSVSSLSWFPDGCTRIAAAYVNLKFQGYTSNSSSCTESYVWDLNNTNDPVYTLDPPSPIVSLEYNPKDVHVIAGGCYNGLVSIWDTRRGRNAAMVSSIECSHLDPVYSVKWLQSKSACELLTGSTDGYCRVWDVRKLSSCLEVIPIVSRDEYSTVVEGSTVENGASIGASGIVSVCYEINAGAGKFVVGSEDGKMTLVNRKVKTPSDRCSAPYDAHLGPVLSIDRNKFYPKYFISAGDWCAKLWIEDEHLRVPLYSTPFQRARVLSAAWSCTKPGLFVTSRSDGVVDFWDLSLHHAIPVTSLPVITAPLCSLSLASNGSAAGKLGAVGSTDGRLAVFLMGQQLSTPSPHEKGFIGTLFDKETKREKSLVSKGGVKEKKIASESLEIDVDSVLKETEDDYLAQLQGVKK
ncbi:hypothetical protein RCL1_007596 [Eukaryota sp. TZLM3-RCL]